MSHAREGDFGVLTDDSFSAEQLVVVTIRDSRLINFGSLYVTTYGDYITVLSENFLVKMQS